jgi:hypothetical protein
VELEDLEYYLELIKELECLFRPDYSRLIFIKARRLAIASRRAIWALSKLRVFLSDPKDTNAYIS